MTAEVAIINSQAVALAADSAVTVGRDRVWKHANKLFSAGPHNDVGVMIYNTGDLLGVPWEAVFKEFRRSCGTTIFETSEEYAAAFLGYIRSDRFANPFQERLSIDLFIIDSLEKMKEFFEEKDEKITSDALIAVYSGLSRTWGEKRADLEFQYDADAFRAAFGEEIKAYAFETFEVEINDALQESIFTFIFKKLNTEYESRYSTGVVIAGFGRNEFFPSIHNFVVDGRWDGKTRIFRLSHFNFNEDDCPAGGILPFAQSDMAGLFVEGVYSKYKKYLENVVTGILDDKSQTLLKTYVPDDEKVVEQERQASDNKTIVAELIKDFHDYREESFVEPLLDTVAALPKEELAFMAKALVELTAFRRKFTATLETVGGAVDVAIISKGDGFVWIDRKHYFDLSMNPDFLDRKSVSRQGG